MGRQDSEEKPGCAKWARDVSAHVTRTMDKSTPYDQATPPPSPPRTQTPRPKHNVEKLLAFEFPRKSAAYPQPVRPADHSVARNDLVHDRQPGYFPVRTSILGPPEFGLHASQKKKAPVPVPKPLPLNNFHPNLLHSDIPQRPTTPRHNISQLPRYRGVVVMPTLTVAPSRLPLMPKEAPKPRPAKLNLTPQVVETVETTTSPKRRLSWSSIVRGRRPGEIFDSTFSFWAPSRRRVRYSPPVSPRQSISSLSSGSPTPTPEEPYIKKQRVDSSGAKATTSPTRNSDGYNHGPAPTGPANIWFQEDISTNSHVATSSDPHPGHPVDFSTSFLASLEAQRRWHSSQEGYHTYLDESRRRSSNPSSIVFAVPIDEYHTHAREVERRVGKETRVLGLTSTIPTRQHSITTHSRPSVAISSSSGSNTLVNSSRSSDTSTDRFLIHIRASQEARRRRSTEDQISFTHTHQIPTPIFTKNDNDDKWLLGDEPL